MKVIYLDVENKKKPSEMDIEDNLDVFYALIGCKTIDIVTRCIGGKIYEVIIDDEGTFKKAPVISAVNVKGEAQMVGNLIITGLADEDGDLTSLTDEDVKNIKANIVPVVSKIHGEYHALIIKQRR